MKRTTEQKSNLALKRIIVGIVVFGIILLILNMIRYINIKNEIELSSSATVHFISEKVFGKTEDDFYVYSVDDEKYKDLSTLLKNAEYKKHIMQDDFLYSHEDSAESFTIRYYNEDEIEQVSITLYSDGVCIIDGIFVKINGVTYEQIWNIIYSE